MWETPVVSTSAEPTGEAQKNTAEQNCVKVDSNSIDEKGCSYICKATWKQLKGIVFSYNSFTQTEITSVTEVVSTSTGETGRK